jgi:copper(I)-binding protein
VSRRGAGRAREVVRAAGAPVLCAAIAIGLLSAWVTTGGAGTITVSKTRIEVTLAAIPMATQNPGPASDPQPPVDVWLTIHNLTGSADALTSVTSTVGQRMILTRHPGPGPGHVPVPFTGSLTIPAHGTLTLSPSGYDAVLIRGPLLLAGQQVPLRLTFRAAGTIKIEATVTIPGNPNTILG